MFTCVRALQFLGSQHCFTFFVVVSCSLPRVVVRCVEYLRQRAMHVSGILQINVAKTDIMNAWKDLEAHGRFLP